MNAVVVLREDLRVRAHILAIAFEVTIIAKTNTPHGPLYVTNCPVCGNEGQFAIIPPETFQCGVCRISGDVIDLCLLFNRGAEVEDVVRYLNAWITCNPRGPSVALDRLHMTVYAGGA